MNKLYPACAFALASFCTSLAPAVSAADLHGQVVFQGGSGDSSSPDVADTVVFFKPDATPWVEPMQGDVVMTMAGKSFVPHVLTVTVGTKVRFPNTDPIFHNIFSPSAPNDFDLGLYDTSAGKVQAFTHVGLVHVYCNVHRDMFGYVLVLDTPYFVSPGPTAASTCATCRLAWASWWCGTRAPRSGGSTYPRPAPCRSSACS